VFDISGFRDIEYDENMRIDNVERDVEILAETIKNTYESKGKEVNSLVSLLGIKPANVLENVQISKDTEVILNYLSALNKKVNDLEDNFTKKPSSSNSETTPPKVYVKDKSGEEVNINDVIEHDKFGLGKVLKIAGQPHNPIMTVQFSEKKLNIMTNYAKFKKVPQ